MMESQPESHTGTRRRRATREIKAFLGKTMVFDVPQPYRHEGPSLSTLNRGVQVFNYDHSACFDVPQWINPVGHYVYFVWGENVVVENGEDEDFLYIGMSSKILYRIAQHSLTSLWWEYAKHIDIFQYETREAALEVEAWAINKYGPLYNVHRIVPDSVPLRGSRQLPKA